jgi:hypothetical protein
MADWLEELAAEAKNHIHRERLESYYEADMRRAKITKTKDPHNYQLELEHRDRVIDLLMRASPPDNEDLLGWRARMLRVLGPEAPVNRNGVAGPPE